MVARRSYNTPGNGAAWDAPAQNGNLEIERRSLIATLGRSADRASAPRLIGRLTLILGALAGFEQHLLDRWLAAWTAEEIEAAEMATVRIEHLRRGGSEEHDD